MKPLFSFRAGKFFLPGVGVLGLTAAFTLTAPAASPETERIQNAVPQKAVAPPKKPRRLLVFTLTRGFKHTSIPVAVQALEIMGAKTGAWTATASDNPEVLSNEVLKNYDAVCFLSTTGDVFTPAGVEASVGRAVGEKRLNALINFVSSGKGFIGIHAATDTAYDWPAYGELIGGYFDGHPWGAGDKVSIRVEDKSHPLTSHLNGENLEFQEEIFQFQAPYSRRKQRVLMSLDLARTPEKKGMKRSDKDYAVSWVKKHGQGRVFYTSIGHREDKFWDAKVLYHYLAGIQFALGDVDGPVEPVNRP